MTASLKGKRVRVTGEIIEKSMRQNSARCMTAVGIAKSVEGAHRIKVDTQTIVFSIGDERYAFVTPSRVMQYVVDFDAGLPIEPFDFRLPEPLQVKTRKRTEHGKALQRADNDRRRKPQQQQLDVPAPPAQIDGQAELAVERDPDDSRMTEPRAGQPAIVEQVPNDRPAPAEPKPRTSIPSAGAKPPRAVLGKNRREYGTRKLRWNQIDELAGQRAEATGDEGAS